MKDHTKLSTSGKGSYPYIPGNGEKNLAPFSLRQEKNKKFLKGTKPNKNK